MKCRFLIVTVLLCAFSGVPNAVDASSNRGEDRGRVWHDARMYLTEERVCEVFAAYRPLCFGDEPVLGREFRWEVNVAVYPSRASLEGFTLIKSHDGEFFLEIAKLEGAKLVDQVTDLVLAGRELSVEGLKGEIEVSHWRVSGDQCRAIADLGKEFEELRLPPVFPSWIGLDGTSYRVTTLSGFMDTIRFRLSSQPPVPDSDSYPLLGWIVDVRNVVDGDCVQAMKLFSGSTLREPIENPVVSM